MTRKTMTGVLAILLLAVPVGWVVSSGNPPQNDRSRAEPTEIVGYLLGDAPAGMELVMDKLNEKLTEDLNATMLINYIGWGDFAAKYPLVLAAGEDIDWIFTANWSFYFQEAAKGAFLNLTDALLKENMPLHYAVLPQAAWDQMRVADGNVYMIPTPTPDKKVPVIAIRGDLRRKYGLDPIQSISELGPYLAAVKANQPNMIPMNLDSQYDIGQPFGLLVNESGPSLTDILFTTGLGTGVNFMLGDESHQLLYMMDEPILGRFRNAARIMKEWYDAGYINRDVFANEVRSKDSFVQGRSAVGFGNAIDVQSTIAGAEANGFEVELIPGLDANGHYLADPYLNNGTAVAASSRHPELTLQILDRIIEDQAYNYLVYFGVEGVNYVIEDGKIALPEGVTADANTYPPDAAGFWFTNKDQFLPLANWTPGYIQLRSDIIEKGYLFNSPFAAFSPDTTDIKAELANLSSAIVQYFQPIMIGAVDNVDASLATLDRQLKAAGVETVHKVLQDQVDASMN